MARDDISKIPESYLKSRIMSISLDSLMGFAGQRGMSFPEDIGKEDLVERIFRENRDMAYELYDATEIRKTISEDLLIERTGELPAEPGETLDRDRLLLTLMEEQRHQILEDVQLLMTQERAKTFRRYILREGGIDVDLVPLLNSSSESFEDLRGTVETRLSFPGKLATLERVMMRDDSFLFFIKYVDKIKYAEEMEGRHWDTLVRRVIAIYHPPSRTLEIGTPDHNRESRTLSTLSEFLTGSEDAFVTWSISTGDLIASVTDPGWKSDAAGSGSVGISYADFTNIDLQGRPQKISLLGDDVLLTLRSLSQGGLDLSKIGSLHKVRFVFKGRKVDLFPEESKYIFLAYMDEKQRMAFYGWIVAMGWA